MTTQFNEKAINDPLLWTLKQRVRPVFASKLHRLAVRADRRTGRERCGREGDEAENGPIGQKEQPK